jgi:hypothetical protein
LIAESSDYVSWTTPDPVEPNEDGLGSEGKGAKYAVAILHNPEYFSIEAWLARYSPDEISPVLGREDADIAGRSSKQYSYGSIFNSSLGQHKVIYIPIDSLIYSFAVYPYEANADPDYEDLYRLADSLQINKE